jgi:cell pole-organizing protein PopZ
MANPSAAHEPSMEEILASIRQIISEDGDGTQAAEGEGAEEKPESSAAEAAAEAEEAAEPEAMEPQASDAEDEPRFEPEAEAAPEFEPQTEPESAFAHGESMTPQYSGSAAEAEPHASFAAAAEPQPREYAPGQRASSHLLSAESDEAVHGAFSALAHTILAQNARTLEDLVTEMLQPMLKSWLDENLPALVERLVQEEIQRVSRGRP